MIRLVIIRFCLCVSHRRRRPSGRPLNFSNLFFHLVCLVKTRSVATIASGPGWFLNLCVHLYTYHIDVARRLSSINRLVPMIYIPGGLCGFVPWKTTALLWREKNKTTTAKTKEKKKKGKKWLTESNKNHYRNRIYLFGLWRYARFSLCVTWHTISGRSWRGEAKKNVTDGAEQ